MHNTVRCTVYVRMQYSVLYTVHTYVHSTEFCTQQLTKAYEAEKSFPALTLLIIVLRTYIPAQEQFA